MAISHAESKRKKTGGRKRTARKKRAYELGSEMIEVRPGEKKVKKVRTFGGNEKLRAINIKEANVLNPKTGKSSKSEIVEVKENSANSHFVRRNTITKGAVIETKEGLAKVTNRPGQEGLINTVLLPKNEQ